MILFLVRGSCYNGASARIRVDDLGDKAGGLVSRFFDSVGIACMVKNNSMIITGRTEKLHFVRKAPRDHSLNDTSTKAYR